MYMHPYTRLYGASVLLFKIEYTVKKLKKFVMPSPVDHNLGISWGVPDSQQILQKNKNEKCHGVCGERGVSWVWARGRKGIICTKQRRLYPVHDLPPYAPNDLSEMLLNRNDDMMKMGVNALYGVVLRM